ncbi:MAG: hypothetical protein BA870_02535 [Desulfuromonadales bacterium C00003094]|nr:MAG: hypothetical protein BA870_02535 [Desulfuromonadales bacterium C00003094]
MKKSLLLVVLLFLPSVVFAQQNILILHSYHSGYEWTRTVESGMTDFLTKKLPAAELFLEEMDTKRHAPEQIFPQLRSFYAQKYADTRFDLILCSDDNALDFLLAYRDTLFPGVPVVFCGINNFTDERIAGHQGFTGVIEAKDYAGTLDIALELHPDTRQVALVSDRTPSSLANLQRLRKVMPLFAKRVDFVELLGLSVPDLQKALKQLPTEAIVLHLDYFRDADGRYYTVPESNALHSQHSDRPVYACTDFKIRAGVVGGRVVSGRQQGETAAHLAVHILTGKSPKIPPVVLQSPNIYMFDYQALQRFGIGSDRLPEGSVILNDSDRRTPEQKQQLWLAMASTGAFALLALALSVVLCERRVTTKALRKSEDRFRSLVETASDWIWEVDTTGRYTYASARVQDLLGYAPAEVLGKTPFELMPLAIAKKSQEKFQSFADSGQPFYLMENVNLHQDGREIVLETSGVPFFDEHGKLAGYRGVDRDITDRKRIQEELHLAKYALDSSLAPTIMSDLQGRTTYVNKAFLDIAGHSSEEEVLGSDAFAFHVNSNKVSLVREALKNKGEWRGELLAKTKEGLEIDVELLSNIVKNPAGEPLARMGSFLDITEKKKAEQEVRRLAYFDDLTGLPNRTLLMDHMELAFGSAVRASNSAAVLLLDLDNFKQINDTLGHAKGDLLLKQVAQRLRTEIRKGETVARWGGDEFVLLLPDVNNEMAVASVARKIMELLTEHTYDLDGSEVYSSASIGIALYPQNGLDSETLLKHADTAMYEAKKDGRNDYHFFSEQMHQKAIERHTLEGCLHRALGRGEFFLVYQPQLDLLTGETVGMEALVRWQSPDRGLVSPAEFIPVAEDSGLIRPLGEWILRTACREAVAWQRLDRGPLRLAVNLSAQQFRQPDFVERIEEVLQETGLDPQLLELELTESVFMENREAAIEVLVDLKARGIQIAIDDFGTGYSSLSYLKNFPIDRIKIAQEFVRDIPADPNDMAIVSATIAMAESLGLKLIAEGVETLEQLEFLQQQGCQEMQGYYFSRPLPADQVADFCRQQPCLVMVPKAD